MSLNLNSIRLKEILKLFWVKIPSQVNRTFRLIIAYQSKEIFNKNLSN